MCENTDSRCTTTRSRPRDPLSRSGLSRFLLLTSLCGMQREVSAAPHRGNANRPLPIQGKANALRSLTKSAAQANNPSKSQRRRQTTKPPRREKNHKPQFLCDHTQTPTRTECNKKMQHPDPLHPLRPFLKNFVWEHGHIGTRYINCATGEIAFDD